MKTIEQVIGILLLWVLSANAGEPKTWTTSELSQSGLSRQPLLWAGAGEPNSQENSELAHAINVYGQGSTSDVVSGFESFLSEHPKSPWAASIHCQLAEQYRAKGRSTKALEHWEAAWEASKNELSDSGKMVAGATLSGWTRLLASLGRLEKLEAVFREAGDRTGDGGPYTQQLLATKEAIPIMSQNPGIAYRCGSFALRNIARVIQGTNFNPQAWAQWVSPKGGFSMEQLVEIAQTNGLTLRAVRQIGTNVVVPSVVHWKQNHYAAIVGKKGDRYHIIDPTFGTDVWMDSNSLEEEASGKFLLASNPSPAEWQPLTLAEQKATFGKGFPNIINDGRCSTCPSTGPGANGGTKVPGGLGGLGGLGGVGGWGPGLRGGRGGPPQGCSCGGMAVWTVSEPFISLWLHDEPLGYQPAKGPYLSTRLDYKQRDDDPFFADVFSFGPHWKGPWLSFINDYDPGYSATVHWPNGSYTKLLSDTAVEPDSRAKYQTFPSSGVTLPTSFQVTWPDGSTNTYGMIMTNMSGVFLGAYLTEIISPDGNKITFEYQGYGTTNRSVKLKRILDGDGHTNTITYHSTFTNQIATVTDPFGRSAAFQYSSSGNLTNITDVVGLTSGFVYDGNGWITNLTTVYGTTTFKFTGTANSSDFTADATNSINRSVEVTQPTGGRDLYVYRDDSSSFMQNSYSDATYVPSVSPFNSIDNSNMAYRNSWHWSPRQYALLSTTNTSSLSTNDYWLGHHKHWLHEYNGSGVVSPVVSLERLPSPDGTKPGKFTWYDYYGKPPFGGGPITYDEGIWGTQPGAEISVQSDGTSAYTAYNRDSTRGLVESVVSTYATNGTTAVRAWTLANSVTTVDLLAEADYRGVMVVSNVFNSRHQIATNYNALLEPTYYFYNAANQLSGVSYPSGLVISNYYLNTGLYLGWLDKSVSTGTGVGSTNSFTYENGLVKTLTDERGMTTTNYYDNLSRLTGQSFSSDGSTISNIYTGLDVTAKKDRLGKWSYFGFNGIRQLTAKTNEIGTVTRYGYCSCGALDYVTNAFGTSIEQVTHYVYDNQGKLTQTYFPDGSSVTNTYNLVSQLAVVGDSIGMVTNYFNNQGLLYAKSNAFGQVLSRTFDILDRVISETDQNGVTTTNLYDDLSRVISRTQPAIGAVELFQYSTKGLITYTNQVGKISRYGYDSLGRKTGETNANTETIFYTYNPAGDLRTLTDGKSQLTSWGYDLEGRSTSKTNAASTEILRYKYDANGRMTNRWSKEKLDTYYTYNDIGNVTMVNYTNSPDITLQYDALGRLTNMVDATGTSSYTFTSMNQLASEDGPWANDTVSLGYTNRLRQSLSLQQTGQGTWNETYGYDSARRWNSLSAPSGSYTYSYSGASLLATNLSLPNGSSITNKYDSLARLTGTWLKTSGGTVQNSHGYAYNNAGWRNKQTNFYGNIWTYTYDGTGQLIQATGTESGGTNRRNEQFGYGYDTAGNLQYRTNDILSGSPLKQTFSADSLNQLTTVARTGTLTVSGSYFANATSVTVADNGNSAVSSTLYGDNTFARTGVTLASGSNSFTAIAQDALGRKDTNTVTVNLPTSASYAYDQNGNMTSDGQRTFTYDDENQLTSVLVTNAWKSEFTYDGMLRRRIRKEYAWYNGAWSLTAEVRYIYDGKLVIQERDQNNLVAVAYTRGRDLSGGLDGAGGIGGLLGRTDQTTLSPTHAYYHSDGNGNVTLLVTTQQTIGARYGYDPFGNILLKRGPLAEFNLYRFSSKELHVASGLIYFLYRFYDPNLQRWVNIDPIADSGKLVFANNLYRGKSYALIHASGGKGIAFESLEGANLVAFAHNDPLNGFDPDGTTVQSTACATAAGAACNMFWYVKKLPWAALLFSACYQTVYDYCVGPGGWPPGMGPGITTSQQFQCNYRRLPGKFQ